MQTAKPVNQPRQGIRATKTILFLLFLSGLVSLVVQDTEDTPMRALTINIRADYDRNH